MLLVLTWRFACQSIANPACSTPLRAFARVGRPTGRAGVAAGVTLTALVTPAGVGDAASSTALELLQRKGMSTGGAIDAILALLATVLLPAVVAVMVLSKTSRTTDAGPPP